MTIRGAVSGRMKRTLACVVESRASNGRATVWGNLLLGCRKLVTRRLHAEPLSGSSDDVDNGVA